MRRNEASTATVGERNLRQKRDRFTQITAL